MTVRYSSSTAFQMISNIQAWQQVRGGGPAALRHDGPPGKLPGRGVPRLRQPERPRPPGSRIVSAPAMDQGSQTVPRGRNSRHGALSDEMRAGPPDDRTSLESADPVRLGSGRYRLRRE